MVVLVYLVMNILKILTNTSKFMSLLLRRGSMKRRSVQLERDNGAGAG
jgi:hypothetical protein